MKQKVRETQTQIFSIFAQWFSRGALGVVCWQADSTKMALLIYIVGMTIASPIQGSISDKPKFRAPAIIIAILFLIFSSLVGVYSLSSPPNKLTLLFIAIAAIANAVAGNATPGLAATMENEGMDFQDVVRKMLLTKRIGILAALPIAVYNSKLALVVSAIINSLSLCLFLMKKRTLSTAKK